VKEERTMQTDATPCYAVSDDTTGTGLRLVTVQLAAPREPADRDHLMTQWVVDLVAHLVRATEDVSGPVAVDMRFGDGHVGVPALEGFVEAARGLVQSYVLESQQGIGPVNVVVSRADQDHDRQLTWDYLAGETGSFSRGATYDLRAVTP
jgi:hypothetical protein